VICPASIEDKLESKHQVEEDMAENKSSISKASTLEEIGDFWDEHDFTEFDDPDTPDVEFEIMLSVAIDPDLLAGVEKQARLRGVSVETLVNLWLQQKLLEATPA
jgi:hypothetical protein